MTQDEFENYVSFLARQAVALTVRNMFDHYELPGYEMERFDAVRTGEKRNEAENNMQIGNLQELNNLTIDARNLRFADDFVSNKRFSKYHSDFRKLQERDPAYFENILQLAWLEYREINSRKLNVAF